MLHAGAKLRLKGEYRVVCRRPDGTVRWVERAANLITNAGLDYLLDAALSGGTPITSWYLGLKNTGSGAAGDTAASHAGWTENQNYDEAARQAWTEGGVSSQSIDNVGNEAVFTISTNGQTIAGIFLISDNTKGGSTGTLFSVTDFSSAKSADDGDTITVTYTVSAADDGA